jgi:hypothetical protein
MSPTAEYMLLPNMINGYMKTKGTPIGALTSAPAHHHTRDHAGSHHCVWVPVLLLLLLAQPLLGDPWRTWC